MSSDQIHRIYYGKIVPHGNMKTGQRLESEEQVALHRCIVLFWIQLIRETLMSCMQKHAGSKASRIVNNR